MHADTAGSARTLVANTRGWQQQEVVALLMPQALQSNGKSQLWELGFQQLVCL